MPTVGHKLAAERTRQGLALEAISSITKLSPRALRAIEADDFDQLPGLVFARNFVRQYAQALNLDPTVIGDQFDREHAPAEEPSAPASVTSSEDTRPRMRRFSGAAISGLFENTTVSAFITFVLTLVVCAATFYAYLFWTNRSPKAASNPARVRAHVNSPPRAAPQKVEAVAPSANLSPAPAADRSKVHVELAVTAPCWVRINADGKIVFAGTLAAGDTRSINAVKIVTIRSGNAGALSIKLNGNDVPSIGAKGLTRTVTLTPAGAQVRTPTPELLWDF